MAKQRDVDGLLRKLRSSRVCAGLPDLIEALVAFDPSRVLGPIVSFSIVSPLGVDEIRGSLVAGAPPAFEGKTIR